MPLHHSENLLYEKVDEFDDKDDHINYVMLEDLPFYKSGVTFRDEIATSVGEYASLRARVSIVGKALKFGGKSGTYGWSTRAHWLAPCPCLAQTMLESSTNALSHTRQGPVTEHGQTDGRALTLMP